MTTRTRNILFFAIGAGLIVCACLVLLGATAGFFTAPRPTQTPSAPLPTTIAPTVPPPPATIAPPAPTTPPSVPTPIPPADTPAPAPTTAACTPNTMPDGTVITAEVLAAQIGGKAEFWTPRDAVAEAGCNGGPWGYWDPDNVITFRHPGGDTMLTYWSGFSEPENARGCWVQIPEKGDRWDGTTRTIQCPDPGATFEADGVGFHPVAPHN